MRDSRSLIDEVEFFDPVTLTQRERARRIVAMSAVGDTHEAQVADASEMMRMLGIHPDQEGEHDPRLDPHANAPKLKRG